ncbi:ketopantoate hydroxymethyltransferase [Melghiribacillus thermohalophilus]|uniref:3-methyl-2-oxobutanoate hydroxymethyltransferase n=1 Tax=Melghiribacillus thermohalophilus TaxID=1324956 RepID=A0A4R3NEB7_9BACI|nr:3-methyl-2-oxobutanoate hydroxymethyltransferase [Melghiribacillus thermohalophilus]TCT25552.1 ketopantoate hydroxymethyltransferase [Melghiribacillus thermohalophilus]
MKNRIKLQKMKENGEKITMITAYDYPSAKLAQEAGIDMILVGDSLGNVVLGYDSTIPVTADDMIHHGKAVRRGADDTFVVIDMPFMTLHVSMEDSMKHAKRIIQETNAQALKVEGADENVLEVIERLTKAGIPVVGHLGLTPQSVHVLGGYRVQGKTKEDAEQLIEDALNVQKAGAIALVLECIPYQLSKIVTEELSIPTIGIGAGPYCDGQVLVYHDMLTYGVDRVAKFVKSYTNLNHPVKQAIKTYINEVKSNEFPDKEFSYAMENDDVNALYGGN